MSDYKSGWPPGPPSQQPPASGPLPMAPPRSVPPAATPQRIPVPGSGPPPVGSVPPKLPTPPVTSVQGQEPVDLDAEVIEAADDEGDEAGTGLQPNEPHAALEPLRPMRRLSIAEPDALRPSAPPPEADVTAAPTAAAAAAPVTAAPVTAALVTAPMGTHPAVAATPASDRGDSAALPPAERLPSFDDPEHHDPSEHDRLGLTPSPPVLSSSIPEPIPSSQDPDEVDTPVPAAPVHVSAPPPFVPPPSPLLPDFQSVPPLAALPMTGDVALRPPSVVPPAPVSPAPDSPAPDGAAAEPALRPSRPPPMVPDAVVLAIQPGTYQAEHAAFETHAPLDDEEVRLSETDLEISITGEPPEVVVHAEEAARRAAVPPPVAPPPSQEQLLEAPVPEVAIAVTPGASEFEAASPDLKKPPPPKRTAKPALPSAAVRRRPWWETLFGDDFARAHRSPSQRQLARDVNFMVTTLALTQNQVVLDLGCGQGEHCVELTRRGVSVVGYDLSVFQLAMAGDRAQQEGQKINFLQGDMREMAFDSMFDAVVCWDTTFGYFEEEKNVDVARRILQSLKPGGSLLLHVMNRDFAAKESPTNIWFEGDGCVCMDDVDFDWITSRLRVKRSLILDDGRSKELHYSVRLYDLSELGKLLHEVGFRVAHVSGDVSTPGAFFGPASPYLIIRAQRP